MKNIKLLFQLAIIWMPWSLRRWLLVKIMKFEIHPTARIGKSIILSRKLSMAENSRIGDLTFAHGLEEIKLERFSRIGKLNWISGFPLGNSKYFQDFPNRYPQLYLHEHSGIVHRNLIDCTDRVVVGRFAVIAGGRHQILTHARDMRTSNQSCAPIYIGQYSMIGTGCIILKGSALPDFSALGAGSTLHKQHTDTFTLYSGVPAAAVKKLDKNLVFFTRTVGTSDQDTADNQPIDPKIGSL